MKKRNYAEDYIDVIDTPEKLARFARLIDMMLEAWLRTGASNTINQGRYNFASDIYKHCLNNIGEGNLMKWLHSNEKNFGLTKYVEQIKPQIKEKDIYKSRKLIYKRDFNGFLNRSTIIDEGEES